jgi:hypothetical protein
MFDFRRAFGVCVAIGILAGCGGSQSPLGSTAFGQTKTHETSSSEYCAALSGGTGVLPDGDFSEAQMPPGFGVVYDRGQVFAPDWRVGKDSINFLGTPYWSLDGLCSVDLDGQGDRNPVGSIISSGLKTKKGQQYNVAFVMSGNGFCAPTTKTLEVSAAKQFKQFTWNISIGNDIQDGDWANESWSFVASKPVTEITLASKDPKGSGCGPVVGGVNITER